MECPPNFSDQKFKNTLAPRIAKFFSDESPDDKYDEAISFDEQGLPNWKSTCSSVCKADGKKIQCKKYPYPLEFAPYLSITANNILEKIYELQHKNEYMPPYDCILADETMDLPDAFMKLLLL